MRIGPSLEDIVAGACARSASREEFGASLLAIVLSGPWGSILTDVAMHRAYLDQRTGSHLQIYFAGVVGHSDGTPWPERHAMNAVQLDSETVALLPPNRPGGVRPLGEPFHRAGGEEPWYWSPRLFNDLRRDLEAAAGGRWQYSGSTDLVMAHVVGGGGRVAAIDWDSVTSLQLDRLFQQGEIRWFGELIERMSRAMETQPDDGYWGLEDLVHRDRYRFGGSPGGLAIRYLLTDVVLPGFGQDFIARAMQGRWPLGT